MKTIYCEKCHIKVAEIEIGSKIKSKAVMLCENCETQRKALEMRYSGQSNKNTPFDDLFGKFGGFGR